MEIRKIMDLVPVLMANGVTGDRLAAAALEAQRQEVIYASVWSAGSHGYHYEQRPRARAAVRKMFPGTVLRNTWEPVDAELSAAYNNGNANVYAQHHQSGNGLGAPWWYNAGSYPGAAAAEAWTKLRASGAYAGVDAHGKRRDEYGHWYLVDMALYRVANGVAEHRSNASVFKGSSGYVEGLGVPGAPLPAWWDDECQAVIDQLIRDGHGAHGGRNPRGRTAAQNIEYHS